MKEGSSKPAPEQHRKPRGAKSREVSSRFLSLNSKPSSTDNGIPSSTISRDGSPVHRKSTSSADTRKQLNQEDNSGFTHRLWPASNAPTTQWHDTLADHLGNDRLKELVEPKPHEKSSRLFSLSRQRSCSEFNRFENDKPKILGGSMRYTDKLGASQRKSSSSSKTSTLPNSAILPGRLSVDENVLYKSTPRRTSFINNPESESDYGDISLNPGYNAKRSGIEVSSKYLHDIPTRNRNNAADDSPKGKRFSGIKNVIKRANSLTGHGSATSQWALSPGRTGSPTMSVENKNKPMSFSTLKPPTSPSRSAKGVEKLLNLGLDLFKTKKASYSQVGIGDVESFHQLRLFRNRLMQWHYANARAQVVHESTCKQSETNLFCASSSLSKLQHSVSQKKLQLQKEKLEMKLNFILQSHVKLLEAWAAMDRQHSSAISDTKECLHSVVCRVPLIEGAKVEPESVSMAIRHVLDLTTAIKSVLLTFSVPAEQTVFLLSKLAEVIVQEKLLLDECTELFKTLSTLEIQENSLRCTRMQRQFATSG